MRQLVIGHLAQASWHLQHALAYCPTTSTKWSLIANAADAFSEMVRPIGRLFLFVRPYKRDESSVRYFGDELSLALVHLRESRSFYKDMTRYFEPIKLTSIENLIASLLRAMSGVVSPLPESEKEYRIRVKARTETPQAPLVIASVRSAEKRFGRITKKRGSSKRASDKRPKQNDLGVR